VSDSRRNDRCSNGGVQLRRMRYDEVIEHVARNPEAESSLPYQVFV
jgi:hypothetical protein